MDTEPMHQGGGTRLAVMAGLSFVAMYVLMYMMVDTFGNVYVNLNQFTMALTMTAAMVLIELVAMGPMYQRGTKIPVAVVSILLLVGGFAATRAQTAVGDREFLKSMIPHHGAALLMCKQANISDPEIRQLCEGIIASQQSEIDWMQEKLSGANPGGPTTSPSPTATASPNGACHPTGCSGQLCADTDIVTTCEFRAEYACYQTAKCERQADGACGWAMTPELQTCLNRTR